VRRPSGLLLSPGEGWGLEHQADPDLRAPPSYQPSCTVNFVIQSSAGPAAYPQAGLKHKKLNGCCSIRTLLSPGEGWGLEHQAAPDLRAPSSYQPSRTVNFVIQSSAGPAAYPQAGLKHKKLKGFCSVLYLGSPLLLLCRGPLLFLSQNPRKPGHPGGEGTLTPHPNLPQAPRFRILGPQSLTLATCKVFLFL
jgi:hypothetical protein